MLKLKGFTLIELMLVIGIIAILAAIVIIAVRPQRQTLKARNAQRQSDIRAILDGVHQQASDNKGVLIDIPNCAGGTQDTGDTNAVFQAQNSNVNVNLRSLLVPNYLADMPADPAEGTAAVSRYGLCINNDGSITVTTLAQEVAASPFTITR